MTTQHTATPKQSDPVAHKPKPKAVAPTAVAEAKLPQRTTVDSGVASPADFLALQRSMGNRAATRLIQTKPIVQRVAEEEEIQAKPLVQREAVPEEEIQAKPLVQRVAEEEELQTKPLIQRAAGPNAAHEIKGEDIEYEIVAHRLAYQDPIPAGAAPWLNSRGYQAQWADKAVGSGLFVGLLLPNGNVSGRRAILAFKGTSPEKAGDVLADLDPVAVGFTAFKRKQEEIERLMDTGCEATGQVDVVGHSLGGALAQHAASAFPGNVKRVVTFQAPGISSIQSGMFKGTKDVTHHVAAGDIVDLAGGKHLPGNAFFHDVKGLGSTHVQYLLNSEAFKSQREAVGLTDEVLQNLGVKDHQAEHSGHVSKTSAYPFWFRQTAVESARKFASPLGAAAVGGLTATKSLASTAKKSWNAGVGGAKAAWQWGGNLAGSAWQGGGKLADAAWQKGGNLADTAWQGTRSWGRDEEGQAKSGAGNWFKRQGGNILGGLGVAGGRLLGGLGAAGGRLLGGLGAAGAGTLGALGAAGSGTLGAMGAAGAGTGALVTGAGTVASGLGALGMGLGGLVVGGTVGAGKWAGEKLWSGAKQGAALTVEAGKGLWNGTKQGASTLGRGLSQLGDFLNPFKKKKETTEENE